jgi:hypothetical protein
MPGAVPGSRWYAIAAPSGRARLAGRRLGFGAGGGVVSGAGIPEIGGKANGDGTAATR